MDGIPKQEQFDVVIVGSGASGSIVAAKAAEAGKSVLILEAGPERKLNDLTSSQIWARRQKWNGAPVEEEGDLKITHAFNAGYGTGGSAMHHYAVWPRLHENDFNVFSEHGKSLDWPIAYKDLQPYYDQVQAEVGISGDAKAEKWRPEGAAYPLPAMPTFAQGNVIAKGFEKMGMRTSPIPLAINSQPYNDRKSCLYDGWCDAGCPIGALANPLVVYLPQAFKAGAKIRHNATVVRVLHDPAGKKATGVEYVDADGVRKVVLGKHIVLAAFVVQNARLLLASQSDKFEQGLANNHDMVGRYLTAHPSNYVFGMFADETQPFLGATGGQVMCQDNYDDKAAVENAFGSYQWLAALAVKSNDLLGFANTRPDIFGAALEPFLKRAAKNFGSMVCVGEDVSSPDNRITLSENKDKYGVPLAKAVHNIAPESAQMLAAAVVQGKAVFEAAGAEEAWSAPPFAMHNMGGTVMGTKAENSVTDSYGRTHELDNLFIVGPGVFPTSGAVNPTFTIHALALRSVQEMLATA